MTSRSFAVHALFTSSDFGLQLQLPNLQAGLYCLPSISFTNIFETKDRPSYRSSSSGKLAVEYVLRNPPVLYEADMAKPANMLQQAPAFTRTS